MSAKSVFTTRIDSFSTARCALVNAARKYLLGGHAIAVGIAALLLLTGWVPNAFVNMGVLAAGLIALLILPVRYFLRKEASRTHLGEAFRMEALAGDLNSRLISALDFVDEQPVTPLMQVVVDRAQEDLALDFESRLDRKPRNAARLRLIGLLVLFIALGFTPWFSFQKLVSNLGSSYLVAREYLFPVVYEVTLTPRGQPDQLGGILRLQIKSGGRGEKQIVLLHSEGDQTVSTRLEPGDAGEALYLVEGSDPPRRQLHYELQKGELGNTVLTVFELNQDVEVKIQFAERAHRSVLLAEQSGEEVRERRLEVGQSGAATYLVEGTEECERRLTFRFANRQSDELAIVFADLPVLENMQTELMYPTYTRMAPKSLEGFQNRIYCLPGTNITLGFTFSRELAGAALLWDNRDEHILEAAGRFASTTFGHSRARTAQLRAIDSYNREVTYPFTIGLEVQPDEKPQVFLPSSLKPEMGMLAEGLKLFGFGVRVRDDYGVSRCILKWRRGTTRNRSRVLQRGQEDRPISPPRRKAVVSFQKVFEHLPLEPDDRISFEVVVYDNRKPDAQMAKSATRAVFVFQQGLEDLDIAQLGFGRGRFTRSRLAKSKRATSVTAPMAMRTREKVWNEYDAPIATSTKPPRIPGAYGQAVRDYFRLMSTAVQKAEDGK